MKAWATAFFISILTSVAFAQMEADIEAEVNAVQGPAAPAPASPAAAAVKKRRSTVDEEIQSQNQVLRRRQSEDSEISADRSLNRFPQQEPLFVKPPGPKEGGSVRVEHPRAGNGLIRINKDGSYQYKTQLIDKSKSGALKFGVITPPTITTEAANVNYKSMYGNKNLFSVEFDYEWQPFRKYGALGVKFGMGFSTVTANGFFKNQTAYRDSTRSEESYNLFIVPLSAFLEYRFEYVRRQWVVPYLIGGGTYYGLAELRNDGASPQFAGAPAVGGGGGVLLSISRLDAANAFTLSQEYGIADMWLMIEARHMQGLSEEIDFTNETISAGIQVDF